MTDLRALLRVADDVTAPDLWEQIRARALRPAPVPPPLPVPPRRFPLLRLAPAAAALVAIVVAAVTLVQRPPSALAEVREAIEKFDSIPPFRATIVGPTAPALLPDPSAVATLELSYLGPDGWRLELVGVSPPSAAPAGVVGSFDLWDGGRRVSYDAATNTYRITPVLEGFSPLGFLSWDQNGGLAFWEERCGGEESVVLPDEEVAGRTSRHIRCGELELWIDRETGLMLRIRSDERPSEVAPEPFPGPIGLLPGMTVEVTSIRYRPDFQEGIFRFTRPPGATLVEEPAEEGEEGPTQTMPAGSIAPAWRAPLLTGGELSTADLRGKPSAVYFWATWCEPCAGGRLDVLQGAAERYGPGMNVVSVAVNDDRSLLEEIITEGRYRFPVVVDTVTADPLGGIGSAWGLRSIPSLVLLDVEGRVVAIVTDRGISADELEDLLEAFAEGRPLPPALP